MNIVIKIPKTMNDESTSAEYTLFPFPTINNEITKIIIGNLPLQGTKLFVRIANNLSRFEVIILVPITPAALQPKPIHMVSACLPQEEHFLNGLSKL
jgi:hypothetical protein